jgi:prepilin-type N-terminal cleavage/methylation domain-containing protein
MMPKRLKGFTLIEMLLVIAIIAILATFIILALNPAETLRKSRDSQRFSDLNALRSAISFYIVSTSTPYLTGTNNNGCKSGDGGGNYGSDDYIYYSLPSAQDITDDTLDNGTANVPGAAQASSPYLVDGTGWVPINFDTLDSGSPLPALPLDPINTVSTLSNILNSDFVYRYACNASNLTFEIDAQLESNAFRVKDDKRGKDGGNNSNMFEVGNNLRILGTGNF